MPLGIEELFRHILPEVIWSDTGQGMERCKPVCDYIKNIYINKWILTDNQVLINVSFIHTWLFLHIDEYMQSSTEYIILNMYIQVVTITWGRIQIWVWKHTQLCITEYRPMNVWIQIYAHGLETCALVQPAKDTKTFLDQQLIENMNHMCILKILFFKSASKKQDLSSLLWRWLQLFLSYHLILHDMYLFYIGKQNTKTCQFLQNNYVVLYMLTSSW